MAFYIRHGSYTEEDGAKGIWWANKNARIDIDNLITTDAGNHKSFQIMSNGEIEEK